jgi:hypothetical protein
MSVPLNLTVNATLPYGLDAKLCSHIIFIPTKVDSHNRISPSDQTHVVMFQGDNQYHVVMNIVLFINPVIYLENIY